MEKTWVFAIEDSIGVLDLASIAREVYIAMVRALKYAKHWENKTKIYI
jgi:hypothetical protein